MESKSIEVYEQRANESDDPNEKELYQWLADWEKGHYQLLLDLNKQLTEKVWNDNNFWPFWKIYLIELQRLPLPEAFVVFRKKIRRFAFWIKQADQLQG